MAIDGYIEEGTGWAIACPALLAVPNVTHQQPVYQSLYCCIIMVHCSAVFNVPIKGLTGNFYLAIFGLITE